MFNFFKKNHIDKKIPADYKHLLDQRGYEEILTIVLQYFKDKGEPVTKVENGYVSTKEEGGQGLTFNYGLDNLVRIVTAEKKENWESVIYTHFNKMNYDMAPLNYFKRDYEEAKQYLKVLIKHESILGQQGSKDVIYKTIFPGTCCVLVFDYNEKFVYLYNKTVTEWDKPVDELFAQAYYNMSQEDITIYTINFNAENEDDIKEGDDEIADAYVFTHGDFAAPALINLQQNAPFAVGRYGSIIGIPAKGAALAAPIHDKEALVTINSLATLALKYFEENPGPITPSLYWYYNEKFEMFPETPAKEGYVTVSVPYNLSQLVNEE